MRAIHTFTVVPSLPNQLAPLRDVAYNLRWAWNHEAIDLFRRLDDDLWESTGHNPVAMLGRVEQARLEAAASDPGFLANLRRVASDLDAYLSGSATWYSTLGASPSSPLVAYFSAEFGLTDCLSIFAGGLGLLAGDHLKSASDLGVPLVGVGLLYQQGYFRQYLNQAGWQQENYENNDFWNLPLHLERGPEGEPLTVSIPYPGRDVTAQIWRAQVGRVPLYLLDTNVAANNREDGDITDQLYGGDAEMRIRQEIALGIGGYRALEALGLEPPVYHMNEGHSAFLGLERIRRLIERHGLGFAEAREAASAGLIFTSHTPVPAGHDYFGANLIDRYFGAYYPALGLSRQEFLGLGRQNPNDDSEPFCMTVLALRLAAESNGVSRLHGEVTRRMWQQVWPGVPEDEVPIGHVTNGVHIHSWISQEMSEIYERYLGPRWGEGAADEGVWHGIEHVPAEELWRMHERRRERLVAFSRRRLRAQVEEHGGTRADLEAASEALDLEALTIGFARRFATYKRAGLLLRDPQRLGSILNDPKRPVQIVFSGKAHPRDEAGKELIRQVVALSRQPEFRRRIVFLEDYDLTVSRYLVQGSDVWLNTPLRPLEASGTSGMKAAANGALNLSTLDGWWDEAWPRGDARPAPIGWAIGRGETYKDTAVQDQIEAEALYDLLERDVVPMFYDRGADGLPRRWIAAMKASIGSLCHRYNTHRMLREYTGSFYLSAAEQSRAVSAEDYSHARELAAWRQRVQSEWGRVRIRSVSDGPLGDVLSADHFTVRAVVETGALAHSDIAVQLYLGRVDGGDFIVGAQPIAMEYVGTDEREGQVFEASTQTPLHSGRHGYTVRVLPRHPDLATPFVPGLITWAPREARIV